MKPRIPGLDEPASVLTREERDNIRSEVKEYHRKTGTNRASVFHSMEDIANYAYRRFC
jgi:ABC-type cobalt transport system, ATPase component